MRSNRICQLLMFAGAIWGASAVARGERLTLVAGGAEEKEPVAAASAKLNAPFGVEFDRAGTLFLVEMKGERVRAIDAEGKLRTIAGDGQQGNGGDEGPATAARFHGMHNLAVSPVGDIYLADTWNNRIRRIDGKRQTIHPFAGTGKKGFSGDGGAASKAEFGGVYCIALAPNGEKMYVADLDNRRIRRLDMRAGTVDTVAGNGERGAPPEGADAKSAPLVDPRAVAADDQGNVYILERSGNALRRVDPQGKIRTLIGPGAKGCQDENGGEPLALKGPKHLCIDLVGNILIADTENHMIRKYVPRENRLVRVAGTGKAGAAGLDGPPLSAQLNQPHGVFVHPSGALYIADSTNNRVVKIVP